MSTPSQSKTDIAKLDQDRISEVIDATEKFTGAEIAEIVPSAMFTAFADGEREITIDDLVVRARETRPLAETASEKVNKLREWAKGARLASAPEIIEMPRVVSGGRQLDV